MDGHHIDVRFARGWRAIEVVAIRALRRPAIQPGVAPTAEPARPWRRIRSGEVLPGRSMQHVQRCDRRRLRARVILIDHDDRGRRRPGHAQFGRHLRRVFRAFLAPGMLAGDADAIGAKRHATPMACPADADAHDLFHSLGIAAGGRRPFARFQGETVLHKHRTRFLFLQGVAGRRRLREPRAGPLETGFGVPDRLLESSRNGRVGRSPGCGKVCRHRGRVRAAFGQPPRMEDGSGMEHTCSMAPAWKPP